MMHKAVIQFLTAVACCVATSSFCIPLQWRTWPSFRSEGKTIDSVREKLPSRSNHVISNLLQDCANDGGYVWPSPSLRLSVQRMLMGKHNVMVVQTLLAVPASPSNCQFPARDFLRGNETIEMGREAKHARSCRKIS